jgi:hypothetical protein
MGLGKTAEHYPIVNRKPNLQTLASTVVPRAILCYSEKYSDNFWKKDFMF